MGSPSFRLLRAGVFAAVCVALSVCAHDLMAASPARWWAPLAGLAAITAIGYALASRERSLAAIVVGVEAAQAGLHLLFAASAAPASAAGPHVVMIDGVPMCSLRAGHHALMGLLPGWVMSGPGMLAAHAAAGGVAALWLRRGERAAWRLAALLATSIARPFRTALSVFAPTPAPARPAPHTARRAAAPLAALRHTLDRRGPPLGAAHLRPALS